MDFKKERLVRFHNDEKRNPQLSWEKNGAGQLDKPLPLYKVSAPLLKPEGVVISENTKPKKIPRFGRFKVFPENHEPLRGQILDPASDIFLQWNRVFLFWCLVALFVDPLFFYLPSVVTNAKSSCMQSDSKLGIVVTCFRSFADAFYLLHMFIKFRTAYISPTSRVFGRGELVKDPELIARRYLKSDFLIDLLASLPLPQIVIWFIIPATRSSHSDHTNNALVLIVLLQYLPRLYLIFPLSSQIIKATGVVTKTAWAGAIYNLLLYMLASHVSGASWYLLSIERHATCWKSECRKEFTPLKCIPHYLDCGTLSDGGRKQWENTTVVFRNCNPANDISFNYGIFENALTNNVLSSKFIEKYLYCLWWGLQNLSSYGTYLQSITVRLEEWRLKRRDTEEWMRHRQLPQDLRERVRRFVQYKWLATRGVDEESILRGLPTDLRRDIQRHLCLDLVRRVPFFSQMDDQLLDAICERLVSSLCTQGTYIVREGDPVTEMLFIIRGRLESSTTNGGRTGFFNSITLRPGDFCGEELLAWALLPKSTINLPSSTRTVRSLVEVEAFALRAEDLKFVANQFRRLHSKKLQHTFRFYSHHWRTWAACFIQAAWRRYKKRMMAKTLSSIESRMVDEQVSGGEEQESSTVAPSLGVTILASRFAANTRRGAQKIKDVEMPKLQKPDEPDFSAEADDE
ncbi:probable cyclic nucleotide-gated ion channel 14 [Carica papaya]|uniref:probable cyclic nucleotide-gated ion channel 14 n=1 Tax=Carica papaya TaxID=3649 RepID=UPI000B8D1215|nr:probable cyclic nucleotide-gated ion channel 14 [Carica papaya]